MSFRPDEGGLHFPDLTHWRGRSVAWRGWLTGRHHASFALGSECLIAGSCGRGPKAPGERQPGLRCFPKRRCRHFPLVMASSPAGALTNRSTPGCDPCPTSCRSSGSPRKGPRKGPRKSARQTSRNCPPADADDMSFAAREQLHNHSCKRSKERKDRLRKNRAQCKIQPRVCRASKAARWRRTDHVTRITHGHVAGIYPFTDTKASKGCVSSYFSFLIPPCRQPRL